MIKVGLTGGIGSGKSTVARVMRAMGVAVYDSDFNAKRLMDFDGEIACRIRELLGDRAYLDGVLDRGYVAGQVFSDSVKLAGLNGIVHPAVRADFREWCVERAALGDAFVVVESAVLFESGMWEDVDFVVVVSACEDLRVARTVERDGVDADSVRRRIAAQMSETERIDKADYVLYANEDRLLIPQVRNLVNELNKRS